ncbi:MAG: TldD/PmbA family protein [Desulfurococcaceae archaeon]
MLALDESLLLKAIDRGLDLGAKYVEARMQDDYGYSVTVRNDKLIGVSQGRSRGVGIRVIVDGSLGFASTDNLTLEGVIKAVEKAVVRAKALSGIKRKPVEFSDEKVGKARYSVLERKPLMDLELEEAVQILKDTYRSSSGALKQAKMPSMLNSLRVSIQEKKIVTSEGGIVESRVPRLYVSIGSTLLYQSKTLQRIREFGGSGGRELVDEWSISKAVVDELLNLEKILVEGKTPPEEKVDIVLGSEVVGLIVHESAGHPMEADRILGREAAQAGESYVKPDMIGKFKVGNKYATVIEDPTIPGSYGFYLYDDECVRARPRYLYKEGVLHEPLHNRQTAKLFGSNSNGASRAMNYESEPIIRMSNTYLAPGSMKFEELIEDIHLGIYVKSYMEWNIDDARWNQRYVGLESYIIRNGELAEPVLNPVLEFTTGWFYGNIVGVDRNLEFYPGTCGKGEPSQGVPVWFGGPNVRLNKMKVGVLK